MVLRETWNKFTEVAFEIFKISLMKQGKFKNFESFRGKIYSKTSRD